jgi:hypothetical protein
VAVGDFVSGFGESEDGVRNALLEDSREDESANEAEDENGGGNESVAGEARVESPQRGAKVQSSDAFILLSDWENDGGGVFGDAGTKLQGSGQNILRERCGERGEEGSFGIIHDGSDDVGFAANRVEDIFRIGRVLKNQGSGRIIGDDCGDALEFIEEFALVSGDIVKDEGGSGQDENDEGNEEDDRSDAFADRPFLRPFLLRHS